VRQHRQFAASLKTINIFLKVFAKKIERCLPKLLQKWKCLDAFRESKISSKYAKMGKGTFISFFYKGPLYETG
jgi:hypothetical protein